MNIYDQLQAVEDRYEELGELLSDPEVVSDTKRFMELSREEANTRETVTAYREYKQVIQSISDAEEMIKEDRWLSHLLVFERHHAGHVFDDGDPHAQRGVEPRELAADGSRSHDDH